MPRISFSSFGDTPFQRLLGHNPEVTAHWNTLGNSLSCTGFLSATLKEQVRRELAFGNGCLYCQAKGKPDAASFDEKTSLAVAFAQVFLKTKGNVPESSFDVLRTVFSEQEISELCAFICFTTSSQLFGAMMNLKPTD